MQKLVLSEGEMTMSINDQHISDNFFFVIPLRSKFSSSNWDKVEKIFNHTLQSVYNQTDSCFKILVGVHDVPKLNFMVDDRVEFIKVYYDVPRTIDQQLLDKGYKKRFLMQRVRELGAGYVMMVDADDFISSRIVEFVRKNNHPYGYYIDKGYEFDFSKNTLQVSPRFHMLCGTSSIVKYFPEDLPEKAEFDGYDRTTYRDTYIFDCAHNRLLTYFLELNRPLKPLPFKGAVYVIHTGENHSDHNCVPSNKRKLFRIFYPKLNPSEKLLKEFSIQLN